MLTPDQLKGFRERRERLFKHTNPRVRALDFAKDAWVLWAAYDMCSFPKMKSDQHKEGVFKKPEDFFNYFRIFASAKASVLVVDEDHKFFREKRGPVAMIAIENNGWRLEPQIEFFHWATRRQRLAAAVSFINVVRYSKGIGACLLRVGEREESFCQHVRDRYGLLHFVGKFDNGREDGDEYLYSVHMKNRAKASEMKRAA